MEFSQQFPQSTGLSMWSPDGNLLAVVCGTRLAIRDPDTMEVLNLFSAEDVINILQWSPNSQFVLCGISRRAMVRVFSIANPEWICRVNEGRAGLSHVMWSPDSQHILTFSDFNIQLTIWSLQSQQAHYISFPKSPPGCVSFSPEGDYLAVATRKDCKDFISVIETINWSQISEFRSTHTSDLETLLWWSSSACRFIIAVDSYLSFHLGVYWINGTSEAHYSANEYALGIKSVKIAPNGKFIAIGSFDESVRLISPLGFVCAMEYRHHHPVTNICEDVKIFQEMNENDVQVEVSAAAKMAIVRQRKGLVSKKARQSNQNTSRSVSSTAANANDDENKSHESSSIISKFVSQPLSSLSSILINTAGLNNIYQPDQKIGIGKLIWSNDGRFLASVNDRYPRMVWIWDTTATGLLCVMTLLSSISSLHWSNSTTLLVCCKTSRIYVWTPNAPSWLDVNSSGKDSTVSSQFDAIKIEANCQQDKVMILSKDRMLMMYSATEKSNEEAVVNGHDRVDV